LSCITGGVYSLLFSLSCITGGVYSLLFCLTPALSCIHRWRSTFYLCIFTYGIRFLWQCPWMWDTHHCWYNYPYQVLTPGLYHYYVTELGFYWSLMFSQFTDIKRKVRRATDAVCLMGTYTHTHTALLERGERLASRCKNKLLGMLRYFFLL
ncbi:unnamed protein product, partial [Oncorhynchus mykiss]